MKSLLSVVVLASVLSLGCAQFGNDFMQMYLLSNMMNRGATEGASTATNAAGTSATGYPATGGAGNALGATGGSMATNGGLGRLFGGGRGLSFVAATGGLGDFVQDMTLCNMMPRQMRMMCIYRQLGM